MSLYAIVSKSGKHSHVVQGLGTLQGIDNNLWFMAERKTDLFEVFFPAYEVIVWASVILTRHKDKCWASHECNKLYSALTEYHYFTIEDYNDVNLSGGVLDLKDYEITKQEFVSQLFSSEIFSIMKEASELKQRKEREPVILNVTFSDCGRHWSFISDHYPRKDVDITIELPLNITTDTARDYISDVIGRAYKV